MKKNVHLWSYVAHFFLEWETFQATGLTFWRWNFFLILAHPVYKMWIIQEPNTLQLWNKQHFEEEKNGDIYHV